MPHLLKILLLLVACSGLTAVPVTAAEVNPPPLLLATVYTEPDDLDAYWVSEKLDGVRAYWNGTQLISRQGNPFQAPDWFTRDSPEVPLDGELWMGRGTFETLSGAVRQFEPDPALWRQIRFMVFDLPAAEQTFDQRLEQLRRLLGTSESPYIQLVQQFRVADQQQL